MNIEERLANIKQLQRYTPEDLQKLLTVLPYYIEDYANKAAEIRYQLDNESAILKVVRANVLQEAVQLKEAKELKSAADRDAYVNLNKAVQEQEAKIRDIKHDLDLAVIACQRLENQFTAVRKFASTLNDADIAMGVSQKYVRGVE